jgi:uncharacterized protein YfaS (alpha-2-macroglobulin family)
MKKTSLRFALLLSAFFSAAAYAAPQQQLTISRITPTGEDVPAGRQIVVEFNRPVVPLGRMDRTQDQIPITISPQLNCHWRWLTTIALACNLNEGEALKLATQYTLTVKPGIRAEDGATLADVYRQTFLTERADVAYASVYDWVSAGEPLLYLYTTQPVTAEALQQQLLFTLAENKQKIAGAIVSKREVRSEEGAEEKPEGEQATDQLPEKKADPHVAEEWQIKPNKALPLASKVVLRLTPGLASTLGPEKSSRAKELFSFDTFPAFKFLGIRCISNAGKDMVITKENGQNAAALCNPLNGVALSFSAPVSRAQVYQNFEFAPKIAGGKKEAWDLESERRYGIGQYVKGDYYNIWLPEVKAAQVYSVTTKRIDPGGFFAQLWTRIINLFKSQPLTNLTDEFGRKLADPLALKFATDHRLPNFEMVYHMAVLEKAITSEVPVYVNNLHEISFNYRSLTPTGIKTDQVFQQKIPAVQDVQFAVPLGLRHMLQGGSGALYGKLSTNPAVKKDWQAAATLFAQVTPYQLQVKLGHFNTLVWVTDLATGLPVPNATITIYTNSLQELAMPHEILASAVTDAFGTAVLPGTQTLDPDLKLARQWGDDKTQLFVRVDKAQDMAIMPLSYDFKIDTWRVTDSSNNFFSTRNKQKYGHIIAWGTTAQGVYRVGDTLQYKLYVRDQDNKTLIPAPKSGYTLQILDPTNKVVSEIKQLQLSEFGAYSGEFTIPKTAAVGWYAFNLILEFAKSDDESSAESESANTTPINLSPMRVLVSDFVPSAFKVTDEINGDLFKTAQPIEVTTSAKLHAGGAYTDATARVTAILSKIVFTSTNKLAKDFVFDSTTDHIKSQQVYQNISALDSKGELHTRFVVPKQKIVYGKLAIESAVQDDRGKYISVQKQVDYAGVDRFVGLKAIHWVYQAQKPAIVEYLVVNERGQPVTGVPVDIQIEREETSSARVKDAGNAYVSDYVSEWKAVATCQGTARSTAPANCEFTPAKAGSYRVTAHIKDTQHNENTTQISLWVVGKDYVLWNDKSDAYLPIVPAQKTYQVGDTARYLIKNPYPGAKALITIERYGVLDRFVETFDSSSPIVEFPIKPEYLPGFYLSVMVVSPRVDKPLENGQIDLGKPTFRMGYLAVPIDDPYKQLKITAKTDQEKYKPRDGVTLQLHVDSSLPLTTKKVPSPLAGEGQDGGARIGLQQSQSAKPLPPPTLTLPHKGGGESSPEPVELAVAVLDEAVFDLLQQGRDYFDPYKGFYQLEPLDLQNYSLLTRLIGRQKFEKKGANPGGDGGVDLGARNFFKFVSYWNPAIKPDKDGNATVTFAAPDNLTGWRVLVMAATANDRLGLGETSFKVNQPTELRPVMPNQVVEGDNFKAGFSVMNRTDHTRTLQVTVEASSTTSHSEHKLGTAAVGSTDKYQQTITLEPYQRTTIWMPIIAAKVPEEVASGQIHFVARAGDNVDADAMEYDLPIVKMRSLETVANYATTTQDHAVVSILFPEQMYTDVGGLNVILATSVIGNIEGAFKYLRDYPYSCWEQKLTKGVMAAHYQQLKTYLPADFQWQGSENLAQQTLLLAANYQAPNGGMAYFISEDRYTDPYLTAYTALAFNWLRQDGYAIPAQVESKLQQYLLTFLRGDILSDNYNAGMTATVRAVALAALAPQGKVTLDDLQRYLPYVKQMGLFGKTYFIQAALQVKGAENMVSEVLNAILAHANQTAGKYIFSEDLDQGYQQLLVSPLRENCAILSMLTKLPNKEHTRDIPFKLMSAITQTRNNRDHWENTQENIFCMQALADYSRTYEQVTPGMTVGVGLNNRPLGEVQFNSLRDLPVTFRHPMQKDDLGRKSSLEISRQGQGRLYYTTQLKFASLAQKEAINAGMDIQREYSVQRDGKWLLLKNPLQIKQGELVRVDIYLSLPAARNFVVVDDPVPGGLEPVNRDLATTSVVDAEQQGFVPVQGSVWFKFKNWLEYADSRGSFYYQELRHDAVRYYSDYLAAGNYHLSYTAQAIATGNFAIMPIKAEEMYSPDVFGKGVEEQLQVQ